MTSLVECIQIYALRPCRRVANAARRFGDRKEEKPGTEFASGIETSARKFAGYSSSTSATFTQAASHTGAVNNQLTDLPVDMSDRSSRF